MISFAATLTKLLLRFTVKRDLQGTLDVSRGRAAMLKGSSRFNVPAGVTVHDGKEGGVDGEWVIPAGAETNGPLILYLHGGAYNAGSTQTHRALVARLALATGRLAFAANYRLAPEAPYPAAVDDAASAFEALAKKNVPIAVMGDSAGGGLSLALTHRLKLLRKPTPQAVVCFSPWANLEPHNVEAKLVRADPMLTPEFLEQSAALYAGETLRTHPEISPVKADFKGFPPLLIQVGSEEILLSDAQQVAAQAEASGVDVRLETWPGMFHVWPMAAEHVPEGRSAIKQVADFLESLGQV